MVRRYEEPIEVRTVTEPAVGDPDAFVWRGRLYLVREVIDHWQERRAWWRDVLEPPRAAGSEEGRPDGRMPSAGAGAGAVRTGARAAGQDREREVWRVAASPGRLAQTGVYDLGADGDPVRWLLLRAQD